MAKVKAALTSANEFLSRLSDDARFFSRIKAALSQDIQKGLPRFRGSPLYISKAFQACYELNSLG